jgi:hypothetical protein
MRLLVLLLLVAGVEDLTPREGSGWAGFEVGTWVRIKNTRLQPDRMLAPTITKMTLAKADDKTLTISIDAENAFGASAEVQKVVVNVSGDAGPGEREKVEGRGEEELPIAGKVVVCDRVQATVTGPTGKRVITKWIARDPKVFAKRVTTSYDSDGKELSSETLVLQSLVPEERTVGTKKVRCVKYATKMTEAGYEYKGTAYLSRDVPGSLVWREDEIRKDGALLLTQRAEALDTGTK